MKKYNLKLGKGLYLIPLFGFGSTLSGRGTDAGEVSATALCQPVKERKS